MPMNEIDINLNVSIEVNSSREKEYAQVLLRKATMYKKEGMLEEAVRTLKKAYSEIAKTEVDFTVETFLRLPAYLQVAGRPEEAWVEYEKLLANGYPNQSTADWVREIDKRTVFDKMRLHLQREKNPVSAVRYGALSYVAELRAEQLRLEGAKNETYMKELMAVERIEKHLLPLLKKAKRTDQLPAVVQVMREWLQQLPRKCDADYESKLNEAFRA